MRIPNVSQVFRGLGQLCAYQVVKRTIADHEVVSSGVDEKRISMVITPMKPRTIEIKPEGQRKWKWCSGFSTEKLELYWTLVGPDNVLYRVEAVTDWSQAGYYEYDLREGPQDAR